MSNKKEIKSYYLSRETAQQVKDKADNHDYMNASNIVEQAIKEHLYKDIEKEKREQ